MMMMMMMIIMLMTTYGKSTFHSDGILLQNVHHTERLKTHTNQFSQLQYIFQTECQQFIMMDKPKL